MTQERKENLESAVTGQTGCPNSKQSLWRCCITIACIVGTVLLLGAASVTALFFITSGISVQVCMCGEIVQEACEVLKGEVITRKAIMLDFQEFVLYQ